MNIEMNDYKFKIVENTKRNGFFSVIHNNHNFTQGYNFLTYEDCIEQIEYMIENKKVYLLIK